METMIQPTAVPTRCPDSFSKWSLAHSSTHVLGACFGDVFDWSNIPTAENRVCPIETVTDMSCVFSITFQGEFLHSKITYSCLCSFDVHVWWSTTWGLLTLRHIKDVYHNLITSWTNGYTEDRSKRSPVNLFQLQVRLAQDLLLTMALRSSMGRKKLR